MDNVGKEITEYTIGLGRAHLIILLMAVPIIIIIGVPFFLVWDMDTFESGRKVFMNNIILYLIVGVIMHEMLHGAGWALFAPRGIRSLKFGIHWKYLAPYCHCREPLKVKHYRIGGALPLFLLGIAPSLFAIATGNGALLSFGIIFSIAAGGDIISLYMLRKFDGESYIHDHPDKMGFYVESRPVNDIVTNGNKK